MVNAATPARPTPTSIPPVHATWCVDADPRDHVLARRNVLAGLWVGTRLGLDGETLSAYAAALHGADFATPGDDDVVAAMRHDLLAAGIVIGEAALRRRLAECHRQALVESLCTD